MPTNYDDLVTMFTSGLTFHLLAHDEAIVHPPRLSTQVQDSAEKITPDFDPSIFGKVVRF